MTEATETKEVLHDVRFIEGTDDEIVIGGNPAVNNSGNASKVIRVSCPRCGQDQEGEEVAEIEAHQGSNILTINNGEVCIDSEDAEDVTIYYYSYCECYSDTEANSSTFWICDTCENEWDGEEWAEEAMACCSWRCSECDSTFDDKSEAECCCA